MTITERNKQNHTIAAELTQGEMTTIFWALLYTGKPQTEHSKKALKLLEDLCGFDRMTVYFDGRGKNGL